MDELGNKAVEYITWYMSLDDERLALSYENCVRNFYILDDINKALEKIVTKNESKPETELKVSLDMVDHYEQKFNELYDMFNERIGRK